MTASIPWINPIGGLGDMLMLSGVLKQVYDADPSRRFHLARRTNYHFFLKGHPAIDQIGFPPPDAEIKGVDYWSMEKLGSGDSRPFQVLARSFGLKTPVEEKLFVPGELGEDPLLRGFIPWKKRNVLIAPGSDSPRKVMHPAIWHEFVARLLADGIFVMQPGRMSEVRIRNAYSLLGLTTPRQMLSLLPKFDIIVTGDNFLMHGSHLRGVPAVVLWGATNHKMYGYPEQVHVQMPKPCGLGEFDDCIGPARNEGGRLYATPCPRGDKHCLDQMKPDRLYEIVKKALP